MSSGELEFPYTPEQVTSGLGEFKLPDEMTVDDHINLFWESEPTGVWQLKVGQTVEAIDQGADVVIVASRFGTGKTLQYGRLIARHYDDNRFNIACEPSHLADKETRSREIERSQQQQVMVIDEMTGATKKENLARELLNDLVGKKPLVLIYPGGNSSIRRDAVELTQEFIATDHPEARVADLGDVPATYIDTQRGAYLLDILGFEQPAIEFFTDVTALRAPRLFDVVSGSMKDFAPESLSVDSLRKHLHFFITSKSRGELSLADYHIGMNIWQQLIGQNSDVVLGSHGPFLTGSLSTHDAIEIYQSLGVPLPNRDEIPYLHEDFDPYDKN